MAQRREGKTDGFQADAPPAGAGRVGAPSRPREIAGVSRRLEACLRFRRQRLESKRNRP
jgi:hypothetical protein